MGNLGYMPALTLEQQRELETIEQRLRVVLSRCGDEHFDSAKAFEYLRTYSVEFFDVFYRFYSRYPAYKDRWFGESQHKAVDRIFACVANNYNARNTFRSSPRGDLLKTIEEHHKHFGIEAATVARANKMSPQPTAAPLSGKQASALALAGIDLASASPLLMELHNAAQARRPNVWAPIPAEPKRRIPRSIHSEPAARRMEAHIQAKGMTQTAFAAAVKVDERTLRRFRTSGKVDKSVAQRIADAMGITLDHFLS
jgi:hypothetical protein